MVNMHRADCVGEDLSSPIRRLDRSIYGVNHRRILMQNARSVVVHIIIPYLPGRSVDLHLIFHAAAYKLYIIYLHPVIMV